MPAPNIVIIMTDQQRADLCAREGFPLDTTPFLDGLAQRGLSAEASETLSSQLEDKGHSAPERLEALLDGVVAAYGAEEAVREELSRSLAELQELERMMESFVGELGKLDESLEVLAAYLQRMRSSSGTAGRRTLH